MLQQFRVRKLPVSHLFQDMQAGITCLCSFQSILSSTPPVERNNLFRLCIRQNKIIIVAIYPSNVPLGSMLSVNSGYKVALFDDVIFPMELQRKPKVK